MRFATIRTRRTGAAATAPSSRGRHAAESRPSRRRGNQSSPAAPSAWQEHSARAAPCGPLPPGDHRDQRQGQGALPEIRVKVGRLAPRDARPLFAGARGAGSAVGYVRARGSVGWPSARSGSGRRESDLWLGRWIARGRSAAGPLRGDDQASPGLRGRRHRREADPSRFRYPSELVGAHWRLAGRAVDENLDLARRPCSRH